ncbi:hypothetical protein AB0D60_36545 [Streptomyces sp. NPDC048306]|uniref:hypothetical protein n=1 Tax=Streptomyces sp. NPDC048306 TaxID=3154502 RepID=UPI0033D99512
MTVSDDTHARARTIRTTCGATRPDRFVLSRGSASIVRTSGRRRPGRGTRGRHLGDGTQRAQGQFRPVGPPEQVVTLVHKDAERGTVLPENFHLALLVKLAEARAQAHNSDEDLILFADLDDNRQWEWSVFTASELWQP